MADRYQTLSQLEHVKLRPNIYVGSVSTVLKDGYFYDQPSGTMKHVTDVVFNEGLLKIINEVLDNAVDNSIVSDNPTNVIKVTMDATTISVANNGRHIPVSIMGTTGKYIPAVIFGELLSGSNFGDNRESIGTNGLGAKLANAFSNKFAITCYDPTNHLVYHGVWKGGMANHSTNKVSAAPAKAPTMTTTVSFVPDLNHFNKGEGLQITSLEQITPWILTRLFQVVVTHPNSSLAVYFNGKRIKCGGFKNYIKSFGTAKFLHDRTSDTFEYGLAVSPTGRFEHQSFVNGQPTTSGGTHTKLITDKVVAVVRREMSRKHKDTPVSAVTVTSKIMVFVNIRMTNPAFTTQTKVELSTPIKVDLDETRILNTLKKCGILADIEASLAEKSMDNLGKALNGSKRNNVLVENYEGAHNAGTKASAECMLFVVEGLSASTMVTIGLSVIGQDNYGLFPIRGKLMNVRGASSAQLKNNAEVGNLMKILGLSFARKYESSADLQTLRYGRLAIMCDADDDGHHITGLLINFISTFWPALITKQNFITRFITPIVKVTSRASDKPLYFYNHQQFHEWEASTSDIGRYAIKHLKGLGTSDRDDCKAYFRRMSEVHLKSMSSTDTTLDLLDNVFNKTKSSWRKKWLTDRGEADIVPLDYSVQTVCMDDFIHSELFSFSHADIVRSIPSAIDGLKKSQRQTLCGAFHHFERTKNKTFKVAQLAASVAAHTNYSHGESSLQGTIVGMAQNFPGSNNVPILYPDGAFGSRKSGGKDAASPRYINTSIMPVARKLFADADETILDLVHEEGKDCEPKFYVPALPFVLFNGAVGIATGFAVEIPAFNPDDIVRIVRARLAGDKPAEPLPFYRGYTTNHLTTAGDSAWHFAGSFTRTDDVSLVITELPIGISTDDYKEKVLTKLIEAGTLKSFKARHLNENEPRFEVRFKDAVPTDDKAVMTTLKLTSTMKRTCMNLLDRHGRVKHYTSIIDIVDDWLAVRMDYNARRKAHQLATMSASIAELESRMKFVALVVNGDINVMRTTKIDVVAQMTSHGIDAVYHDSFLGISLLSLTKERIADLKDKIKRLQDSREVLERTTTTEMYLADLDGVHFDPTPVWTDGDDETATSKRKRSDKKTTKSVKRTKK